MFIHRSTSNRMAAAALAGVVLLAGVASVRAAEEPRGCDKFRWPVEAEQQALRERADPVRNGAQLQLGSEGRAVSLVPLDQAALERPPERMPREGVPHAALLRFAAPATAQTVQVTLSSALWIDLVQDGRVLKPVAFSGAVECPGVRKLVRFALEPKPFVLQLSGGRAETVGLVVAPVQ